MRQEPRGGVEEGVALGVPVEEGVTVGVPKPLLAVGVPTTAPCCLPMTPEGLGEGVTARALGVPPSPLLLLLFVGVPEFEKVAVGAVDPPPALPLPPPPTPVGKARVGL